MHRVWLTVALTMTIGCGSRPPQPVDIETYDICASCRMAVSQKQFAAEIIDRAGNAQKFDDIGCMLRFRDRQKAPPAAVFVIDYRTRKWLDAGSALYIHSDKLQTPMAGGLAAFGDRVSAEAAGREFSSPVLAYSQLNQGERNGQ